VSTIPGIFWLATDMTICRLCIKGRHSDEAYLCTATQTFALREMTQSNSLLLCNLQDSDDSISPSCVAQVSSNVAEIWELMPVVARTGRIAQLLQDSMYMGEDEEEETMGTGKKYTPQQVASIVQASTKELQEGIDENHVIVIDGEPLFSIRSLDPSLLT
jgi:sister chromatid cohesion protein DCC1